MIAAATHQSKLRILKFCIAFRYERNEVVTFTLTSLIGGGSFSIRSSFRATIDL